MIIARVLIFTNALEKLDTKVKATYSYGKGY